MLAEYLFYFFSIIAAFILIRKKVAFLYYIPIFQVIVDMSFAYFQGYSFPSFFRGAILGIFYLFIYEEVFTLRIMRYMVFFFIYTFLKVLMSTEIEYSLKAFFQLFFSMSFFGVGYYFISNLKALNRLNRVTGLVILLSLAAILVGYIFGLGKELEYTSQGKEAEIIGLLGSGGLYTAGVGIALLPLIYKSFRPGFERNTLLLTSAVTFIFIVLNIRRTAIAIPLIGLGSFLLFSERKIRYYSRLIPWVAVLLILFPLYSPFLLNRFEIREAQGRFTPDFYKTEARYQENVKMINDIVSFTEPGRIIFGLGENIFAEHISGNRIVSRMYHSDTAKLYFGAGIFGLFLYLAIYIDILYRIVRVKPGRSNEGKSIKATLIGLFLISILVTLNGSITLISFRSLSFLYIGGLLRLCSDPNIINGSILSKVKSVKDRI